MVYLSVEKKRVTIYQANFVSLGILIPHHTLIDKNAIVKFRVSELN